MLNPVDLKVELLYPNKSMGGQYTSFNWCRMRVTHTPTDTVVELTGRSQHKTRAVALEMLEWALASKL